MTMVSTGIPYGGSIKGIDTELFLTGLDQALTTRQLPKGIGSEYMTTFRDIAALFKIEKGVVTINEFNLNAEQVSATGLGKIDIGNQTIDFSTFGVVGTNTALYGTMLCC